MRLFFVLSLLIVPHVWATSVNVQTYGAKPDGVTDDTVAITNASSAVAAQGGQLYFPAGTYLIDPTKGHLVLGSNMTISGPGVIRVKPNVGNFEYVIGPTPTYRAISNVSIEGITIDENVLNNPSIVLAQSGRIQNLIEAYALDGLTISNSTFYLSGVYLAFTWDHLTMTGDNVVFQKRSDNSWFDNSSVYVANVKNATCSFTHNHWSASTPGANTALELHYTQNCVVDSNTFDNYSTAVLGLDSNGLAITNNTVTHGEYAVSLWSETNSQNVTVNNNNISVNNADRQSNASAGVALYWCTICGTTGSFYNITIENNQITFQPEVRTNLDPYSFWGIGLQPAGNVDSVTVTGNTITNAPIRGIKVGNALVANLESNVLVENNTLVNCGNNTSENGYEAALALEGHLSNVTVSGNQVHSYLSVFPGHYGLWSNPAGSYSNVTGAGNTIGPRYTNLYASSIKH